MAMWRIPSGYVKIANGPVEIVDLPIKNSDFPWFFACLPEGNGWGPHDLLVLNVGLDGNGGCWDDYY